MIAGVIFRTPRTTGPSFQKVTTLYLSRFLGLRLRRAVVARRGRYQMREPLKVIISMMFLKKVIILMTFQ